MTRWDYASAVDLPELVLFAQRIWSVNSRWHIGDLAWNLGQVLDGRPDWRMALWRDGGEVDLPPAPELPAGFTVRPVRDDADLLRHAALHREVWPRSALTDDGFRAMTGGWPYQMEFDVVVEAPDGRLVAYCLGWYDEVNRVGEFEPVGTLPEFRRLGLSRAAGIAVLRAFREAGGELALVYPRGDDDYPVPKQVYAAPGDAGRVLTFTRKAVGAQALACAPTAVTSGSDAELADDLL